MAEKAPTAAAKKKIYKKPTPVKSVDSGKIATNPCSGSCGQLVSWANDACGH